MEKSNQNTGWKGSEDAFFEIYSPSSLALAELNEAYHGSDSSPDDPTLAEVASVHGLEAVIDWVKLQLGDYIKFTEMLKLNRRLTDLAILIATTFPNARLSDVRKFIIRAKKGHYGDSTMYTSSCQEIYLWFVRFMNENCLIKTDVEDEND